MSVAADYLRNLKLVLRIQCSFQEGSMPKIKSRMVRGTENLFVMKN
jgi:hypothetical protein